MRPLNANVLLFLMIHLIPVKKMQKSDQYPAAIGLGSHMHDVHAHCKIFNEPVKLFWLFQVW
jgi:hypothetical protein